MHTFVSTPGPGNFWQNALDTRCRTNCEFLWRTFHVHVNHTTLGLHYAQTLRWPIATVLMTLIIAVMLAYVLGRDTA